MSVRQFPWKLEAELLVWCARTSMSEALQTRIRQRVMEPLDWSVLLNLAGYHGVFPLLYRNLSALCSDLVPADMLARLRQKTQAGALLNHSLAQELGIVCEAFGKQGVPVIPIKGATLALSAYGDLTLRDFSDMDLLIPKRAIEEARAILLTQGYEQKAPARESDHDEGPYHVFVKKRTLFRVDLQWVMAHEHFTFHLDRPEFWAQRMPVRLGNKMVQGLAPEDLLIVLCVHGSKHAWEQLKWVCDVAELLRSHPDLDWERIFSNASIWGCRRLSVSDCRLRISCWMRRFRKAYGPATQTTYIFICFRSACRQHCWPILVRVCMKSTPSRCTLHLRIRGGNNGGSALSCAVMNLLWSCRLPPGSTHATHWYMCRG